MQATSKNQSNTRHTVCTARICTVCVNKELIWTGHVASPLEHIQINATDTQMEGVLTDLLFSWLEPQK